MGEHKGAVFVNTPAIIVATTATLPRHAPKEFQGGHVRRCEGLHPLMRKGLDVYPFMHPQISQGGFQNSESTVYLG